MFELSKKNLKIVFFGTPDFAVESLKAIVENGFNVAAVVTATDKPAGRGHRMLGSAMKQYAEQQGLRILQPERLKNESFIAELREIGADLFIVIAFRMLPEIVWSMPRLGTFNLHASLLPKYRGAAPINRAVMAGENKTGVTTFFLSHEIDTGDVIDMVEIDILPDDNAGNVHDKLMEIGARLTVSTIEKIIDGSLSPIPQEKLIEKGAVSCPAPKIFKETGNIDWNNSGEHIHNLVRGLSPYPGAWSTVVSDVMAPTEMKIFRTVLTDKQSAGNPGDIIVEGSRMYAVCGDKSLLEIAEVQLAGKKRMDADAFLRGARLLNARFEYRS